MTPSLLPAGAVARMLGRSPSWFRGPARARLEAAGFPKRDPVLGGWHRTAVEAWLAHRAGTGAASPDPWVAALDDRAA